LEILITQHLRRVVPRVEVSLFTRKESFINETGRSQGYVQKGLQECLYITVLSPDPMSATPTSSALKTTENTDEAADDPEPADEGDIQMKYSPDWFYSPSIKAVTKKYL
jgi:hypothetical protein